MERARKAEAEAQALKAQLKQESASTKKTIREMEVTVAESTALSAKSEREYLTLRDSLRHLTESWKTDLAKVKEDLGRREVELQKEAEAMAKKYADLCKVVEEERYIFISPSLDRRSY